MGRRFLITLELIRSLVCISLLLVMKIFCVLCTAATRTTRKQNAAELMTESLTFNMFYSFFPLIIVTASSRGFSTKNFSSSSA